MVSAARMSRCRQAISGKIRRLRPGAQLSDGVFVYLYISNQSLSVARSGVIFRNAFDHRGMLYVRLPDSLKETRRRPLSGALLLCDVVGERVMERGLVGGGRAMMCAAGLLVGSLL